MSDEKTYVIGGTSVYEGVKTFRVANGKMNLRVNMLRHYKHEDIDLVELPKPMTKVNAIAWLITQGYDGVVPTRAADKTAENEVLLRARRIAEGWMKAAKTREKNKRAAMRASRTAVAA